MTVIETILSRNQQVAMLIGNGPNLAAQIIPSWKDLLNQASDKPITFNYDGLANTELYDLVELNSKSPKLIKERVKKSLELKPSDSLSIHNRIMELARLHNSPVLTTNFDTAFETSINAKQFHIDSKGFTRFYPWKTYYGFDRHSLPTDGFGIWKVQGDVRYMDSMRLGLTDYMGSVERARKLIHNGEDRLFQGKRQNFWKGHQTWLHIWFNLPIIVFGLGYGIDEVFLRWLLIERKRYLNLYLEPMNMWFVTKDVPEPGVKNLMENLGVEIVLVNDYFEIYG